MVAPVPWEHVGFLARAGEADLAAEDLGRPGRVAWPREPAACAEARQALRAALPENHRSLVDLSLLSTLLVCPGGPPPPLAAWVGEHLPVEALLGVGWGAARVGRWAAAPVPVVRDGAGRILFLLVGAVAGGEGPTVPGWAGAVLDDAAAGEVADAFAAARTLAGGGSRLVAVPLTVAVGDLIREHSLGLPLALAAVGALTGEGGSPRAVATGDVGPDGRVWGIAQDSLSPKAEAARNAGFSLLLFPSSCPHVLEPPEGLEAAGVGTLAQAWRWVRLYTPGGARDLNCLEVAVENPRCFVAHCRGLSPPLLAWCREQRVFEGVDPGLLTDWEFVRGLCGRMEDCLASDPPDLEAAETLATILPPGPRFDVLAKRWPAVAFRWCSARYAAASFLGRRDEAEAWARMAEALAPAARVADPDAHTRFVARCIRFGAGPGMAPTEIPQGFLERLSRQREIHRLRGGVDPLLGELHEAAARHLGSRGRTGEACQHLQAGLLALGEGKVPEWRPAWQRQHGQLAFALMDAGDLRGAERAVLTCLGAGSWRAVAEDPAAVARHLVARFLADARQEEWAGPTLGPVLDALLAAFPDAQAPARPPWHLWSYNVGRLELAAGRPNRAREAWRRSAELCRGFQDPPVSSMLPLAGLAALGPLAPDEAAWAAEAATALQGLPRGTEGCRSDGAVLDLLACIRHDPSRFFPFDHR